MTTPTTPVPPAARKLVAQWMRHEEPTPQRLAEMIDDLLATRDREVAELTAQVAEYEREEESDQRFDKALRDGTNAMMRECLGPEMYSRLWGYELERLGRACDWLRAEAAALLAERDALREAELASATAYELERAAHQRTIADAGKALDVLRGQGEELREALVRTAIEVRRGTNDHYGYKACRVCGQVGSEGTYNGTPPDVIHASDCLVAVTESKSGPCPDCADLRTQLDAVTREATTWKATADSQSRQSVKSHLRAERAEADLLTLQGAYGRVREALSDQRTGDNCWCDLLDREFDGLKGDEHLDYCTAASAALSPPAPASAVGEAIRKLVKYAPEAIKKLRDGSWSGDPDPEERVEEAIANLRTLGLGGGEGER